MGKLIRMGVGAAVMLFGLMTCCCGFLLLVIPYVNAVCLLPVTVFTRHFSIDLLRQFGPECDV